MHDSSLTCPLTMSSGTRFNNFNISLGLESKNLIPEKVYEKIIKHCKNCTFYEDNMVDSFKIMIYKESDIKEDKVDSVGDVNKDVKNDNDINKDVKDDCVESSENNSKKDNEDVEDSYNVKDSASKGKDEDVKNNEDQSISDNDAQSISDDGQNSDDDSDNSTDVNRMCVLKILLNNILSSTGSNHTQVTELSPELLAICNTNLYINYQNINILHLLCLQPIVSHKKNVTKRIITHQYAVSKLLRETLLDFDINRYLISNFPMIDPSILIRDIAGFGITTSSMRLKIALDHGANPNKPIKPFLTPGHQYTLLHGYISNNDFKSLYMLLRAGYNTANGFMYHWFTSLVRGKTANRFKTKKRIVRMLNGWERFRSVVIRVICRHRRNKLIGVLNYLLDGFIDICPIIAFYCL